MWPSSCYGVANGARLIAPVLLLSPLAIGSMLAELRVLLKDVPYRYLHISLLSTGDHGALSSSVVYEHLGGTHGERVLLPTQGRASTSPRLLLPSTLASVVVLAAAFVILRCSRSFPAAQISRMSPRVLAEVGGDSPPGACGGASEDTQDPLHTTGRPEREEGVKVSAKQVLTRLRHLVKASDAALQCYPQFRVAGTRRMLIFCTQELAALSGLLDDNLEAERQGTAQMLIKMGRAALDTTSREERSPASRNLSHTVAFVKEVKNPRPPSEVLPHSEQMAKLKELSKIQQVAVEKAIELVEEPSSPFRQPEDLTDDIKRLFDGIAALARMRRTQLLKDEYLRGWMLECRNREGHRLLETDNFLAKAIASGPPPPFPQLVEELEAVVSETKRQASKQPSGGLSPQRQPQQSDTHTTKSPGLSTPMQGLITPSSAASGVPPLRSTPSPPLPPSALHPDDPSGRPDSLGATSLAASPHYPASASPAVQQLPSAQHQPPRSAPDALSSAFAPARISGPFYGHPHGMPRPQESGEGSVDPTRAGRTPFSLSSFDMAKEILTKHPRSDEDKDKQ